MTLRVVIVDDEELARRGIRTRLQRMSDVDIVAECSNGRQAIDSIRRYTPDLVFLDVQMPGKTGFDVIEDVGWETCPNIIFVTAHDQYAIRAFEINALDYLLKPVTAERFHQSLERATARLGSGEEAGRRMISLLEAMANPSSYTKRLAVRSGSRTLFVPVDDI